MSFQKLFLALTGAFAITLGATASAQINSCGGQAAVFNVFKDGKFGVSGSMFYTIEGGKCLVKFHDDAPTINVVNSNMFTVPDCKLNASGQNVEKLKLPEFPSNNSTTDINLGYSGPSMKFFSFNGAEYHKCTVDKDTFWIKKGECKKINQVTQVSGLHFPSIMSNGQDDGAFVLESGKYKDIKINLSRSGSITLSPETHIKFLESRGASVRFKPGNYYIEGEQRIVGFKLLDVYDYNEFIADGATGRVNLHMKGKASTRVSFLGSICININKSCRILSDYSNSNIDIAAQSPDRFAIFVHSGDLKITAATHIAAAIYLHDGEFSNDGNSNVTFVGEAVAQNILFKNNTQNGDPNQGTRIKHQDTGVFGTISTGAGDVKVGLYSPSRPAIENQGAAGSLAYLAYQSDFSASPAQKFFGTIRAFTLNADGSSASNATWDAAERSKKDDRQSKLNTGTGAPSLLGDANLPTGTADRIWSGPGETLAARWQGLLGRPQNTQPVIFKDILLFSTSDGFVYAVNKVSGELQWAWSPPTQINKNDSLPNYQAQIEANPMHGQLGAVRHNDKNYVFGTAQEGAIHFALELNANFDLMKTLWIDERSGKKSPNAETPIYTNGAVIYVVDNKLVIRNLATGAEIYNALPLVGSTISSSPYVYHPADDDPIIYLGTSNGNVFKATLPDKIPNNWSWTQIGNAPSLLTAEPVLYILFTKTSDNSYLTLQAESRITTYKLDNTPSDKNEKKSTETWLPLWTSAVGSAQLRNPSTGNMEASTLLPALGAKISDKASSLGGFIFVPVTIFQSGRSCDSEARLYLIPLDPNLSYYKAFKDGSVINTGYISIGSGRAYTAQAIYLSGKFIVQGHSEQNSPATKLGLDDPIELRPIPPNSGPGRRSWREIIR